MISIVARVLGPADELPAVAWDDGKVGQVSNTGRAAGALASASGLVGHNANIFIYVQWLTEECAQRR